MTEQNLFDEFLNKEVKVPYRDFNQDKIARGILVGVDDKFIKINGKLGTIILHKDSVTKMGLLK